MGFWDVVASAGPYANNLHPAPDRYLHQHPITQFLQAGFSSWCQTNGVKAQLFPKVGLLFWWPSPSLEQLLKNAIRVFTITVQNLGDSVAEIWNAEDVDNIGNRKVFSRGFESIVWESHMLSNWSRTKLLPKKSNAKLMLNLLIRA